MTWVKCSNCGKETKSRNEKCPYCDEILELPEEIRERVEVNGNNLSKIAIGLGFFGMIIAGGIYLTAPAVFIAVLAVLKGEKNSLKILFMTCLFLLGNLLLAFLLSFTGVLT